ncbi:MAG: MBL fold metallo-hydrolase [Cyclobacteriaceae bacterium]|nr:MBL fold metallo-hydrolase [Cyclobacteriaceae bacterium]
MKRKEFIATSALLATSLAALHPARAGNKTETPEVKIKKLSWAGIQIECDGTTLFIDPWISKEIWGDKWNKPVINPVSNTSVNHIAVTHIHNDHLDPKAIRMINGDKRGNIYGGSKTAGGIASHGLYETKIAELWEPMLLSSGKMTLIAVPAVDFSGIEQVSWVIRAGDKTLFHGGDTIWHGYFHKISYGYGPFDVVFLPINGVDFLQLKPVTHIPATLNPVQAATAAEVLRAKLVVPIHYGVNNPGVYEEFPNAEDVFITECKKRNLPVEVCEQGNWLAWKSNR